VALLHLRERRVVDVVAVVTRPDRDRPRGEPAPRPVRETAERERLPVLTDVREIPPFAPDLLVWAAYGKKIPAELLRVRHGGVNVHASLLPRWRGPAPVQAAILAGDRQTGVTLMKAAESIDTGDILASRATEISPYENAESLELRLADMGGELLDDALPRYLDRQLVPTPQDEADATWSRKLTTEDCILDFSRTARENWRIVRAAVPRPTARTTWHGRPLLVWRARVSDKAAPVEPGRVWLCGEEVCVDTAEDLLVLQVVQPGGKRKLSGPEWARGARLNASSRFPS
jgi:methionyl-tRNA formyltransferase